MNINTRFRSIFLIITTLISILGGYLIFHATTWGPWAFSDSSAYISAARNMQSALGAVIQNSDNSITPVTEFPPFFPFVLSLITPQNGNLLSSDRWMNIILFTICTFIIGLLAKKASKDLFSGILASTLFILSPVMIETFSGFMSEPLFIGLLLLLVFIFFEFVHSNNKLWLIPIFIFSALLPIVRYAGILFIFCFSFFFLIFFKKRSPRSIHIIPFYLLISLVPIGAWFISQYAKLNKVGGKNYFFSIEIFKNIYGSMVQELQIIRGWMPYSGIYSSIALDNGLLALFTGLFLLSFILGMINSINKWKFRTENPQFLFLISFFIIVLYIFFIGFTHNLTIPSIDIIDRMMAPVFPFLILALILGFGNISKGKMTSSFSIILIIIAIISSRYYFLTSASLIRELSENGKGFTTRQYQESKFLARLTALPSDQVMISNSAAFVLFHTNRFPYPVEQFHNKQFGSGNSYGEKAFRQKHAALIILFPEFRNYYGINSDQLLSTLTAGLQVDFQDEIGGIYYYPKRSTPQ